MLGLRFSLVVALAAATPTPAPTPHPCPTAASNPAPADTYRRRLGGDCVTDIAGYAPETDVDQHAFIDLDMEEMLGYLEDQEPPDFTGATDIYENGGNSIKGTGFRTLQAFAQKDLTGEPIGAINSAYWGSTSYADDEISAALAAGTSTGSLGSSLGTDYSSAADVTREQVAKKITAYTAVWIYTLHEYEAAIVDCEAGDTYGAQHAWDEGWAFYAGSLQSAGDIDGNLLYYLAQKRCENYGTCTGDSDGSAVAGTAMVNKLILQYSEAGLTALATDDCTTASAQLDLIKVQMKIPLIQGMLRYLYKSDPSVSTESNKEIAEGWAFAFGILPLLDDADPTVSAMVVSNMKTDLPSPVPDGYVAVKTAIESTYEHLGVTCADIGGLVDSYDSSGVPTSYIWEACADTTTSGSVAKQGLAVSAAIVSALGAMLMAF